jgi:hypothetical protein
LNRAETVPEAHSDNVVVFEVTTDMFIALTRPFGIPTRYVSGYLYRDASSLDRSTDGATHAWVEAFLRRSDGSASPLSSDVVPFTPWMSREAGVAMPRPDAQQDQQQQ